MRTAEERLFEHVDLESMVLGARKDLIIGVLKEPKVTELSLSLVHLVSCEMHRLQ